MEETASSSSKRLKTNYSVDNLKINDTYIQHQSTLSEAFCLQKPIKLENEAEVITNPFTCCVLPDFIQPDGYLKELRDELTQLDMERKVSDLYQFFQSKDLGDSFSPQISKFKKLLSGKIFQWMKTVTKIPLTEINDIFCSCYSFTDHLLCHDDELEGRRIAYIFYLVPEWCEADGGCLDLFNTVDGQPSDICKTIVPKWNNFVFFEVSPVSYHQVSEILTSKKRIALSGWFYGPPLAPSVPIKEAVIFEEPSKEEIDIAEWINPMYLHGETQLEIRESFEDCSEISLNDFLIPEKYEKVCEALVEVSGWKKIGPPNLRIIYEMEYKDKIPPILKKCQALFISEAFLVILSNFTCLKLHPACEEGTKLGQVASYIRKWCPGSYTLLHNHSFSLISSLHAFMYFNCPEWDSSECGGYTSFIDKEESEELLRIEPSSNTLALVYTTQGTSHFVKYINSKSKKQQSSIFYDIYSIYLEEESDYDEDKNDDSEDNEE